MLSQVISELLGIQLQITSKLAMDGCSGGDQDVRICFQGCSIQPWWFPWQQTSAEVVTRLLLAYEASKDLEDEVQDDIIDSLQHVEAIGAIRVFQLWLGQEQLGQGDGSVKVQ